MPSPMFSDDIVSKLAIEVEYYEVPSVKLSTIRRSSPLSSIGRLEILSTELLLAILENLDMRSLSRLSCTSFKAKDIVENFKPYTEIIKHASGMVHALARSRLERTPSAYSLFHQVLLSDVCTGCGSFATWVFLHTCERTCIKCSFPKKFQQKMPDEAEIWFGLCAEQLATLPFCYDVGYQERVFTVEHLTRLPESRAPHIPSRMELALQSMTVNRRAVWLAKQGCIGHLPVPYLSKSGPDSGCHCLGCDLLLCHAMETTPLSLNPDARIDAAAADSIEMYSRDGFLQHIEQCPGVRLLLEEWGVTP